MEIRQSEKKPFDTLATLHNVPAPAPQPFPSTNVLTRFPQKPPPVDGVKNVRNQTRIVVRVGKKNHLPLKLFGPTNGRCMNPDCNGTVTGRRNNTNLRMVLTDKLPYYVQGVELQCDKCDKSFQSLDKSYVDTPPMETQSFLDAVIPGKSVGIQMSLVRRQRNGAVASEIEQSCRANVRAWHSSSKQAFLKRRNAILGTGAIVSDVEFENFSECESWIPSYKQLLNAYIRDYLTHRQSLRREMAAYVSSTALAVDHQRRVAQTIKKKEDELNTQTITVVGDGGVVVAFATVPDTGMHWGDIMFTELKERHGGKLPDLLFVDTNCCSGKRGGRNEKNSTHFGMWKTLDVMHCISRMISQCNSEHPRKSRLSRDLSKSFLTRSPRHVEKLEQIRRDHKLKLTTKQLKEDIIRHVPKVIGPGSEVASLLLVVVKTHIALDRIARQQWLKTGEPLENLNSAHVAHALMTNEFLHILQNQLVHVLNGCLSDQTCMYVETSEINYRKTGVMLNIYIYTTEIFKS